MRDILPEIIIIVTISLTAAIIFGVNKAAWDYNIEAIMKGDKDGIHEH